MNDNFDVLSKAFQEEFIAQNASTFHKDLHIVDLRDKGRGRGIIATADIPADTELFTIPRGYVISVENSRLHQQLPQLFEKDASDDGSAADEEEITDGSLLPRPWLDLILVLIHDYLHRDTSAWKHYWSVLPSSFDTLMFWTERDLAELQASSVKDRIGKTSADEMFKTRIIPLIRRHEAVFYSTMSSSGLEDDELLSLCHRMGSLIMAYAFDLQASDEDNDDGEGAEDGWAEDMDVQTAMGMVPMADMLNADAEFNAHLEHGDTNLTMRSLRVIKRGEEVLNYYGPLGNGDLARRYGYTSDLHSRYDVVEITWDAVVKAMEEHFGTTLSIDRSGIDDEDLEEVFVLERETGDPDETGKFSKEAKFTTFPEDLIDQVTAVASFAIGVASNTKPTEPEKKKLKRTFLQVMKKVISRRLAEYPTTMEQDEAAVTKPGISRHLKMALDIRMGEKRLLHEASDLVDELLQKYDGDGNNVGSAQEPPHKKRRTG